MDNFLFIFPSRTTEEKLIDNIIAIKNEETRSDAIKQLIRFENNKNLPIYLWYSTGVMAGILQEIITLYTNFTNKESEEKIKNIIHLFQIILENPNTRKAFIDSQILIFLYPFLTRKKSKLQISILYLIQRSTQQHDSQFAEFIVKSELIPILLKTLKKGSDISKKIICSIIMNILEIEVLFNYISELDYRLSAIILYLVSLLKDKSSSKFEPIIFKIFLKLSEIEKAKILIKKELPEKIYEENYKKNLDEKNRDNLNNLLNSLGEKISGNESEEKSKTIRNKKKIQNIEIVNSNSNNDLNN